MIIVAHRMTIYLIKHIYDEVGQFGDSAKDSHICTIEENAHLQCIGVLVRV